MSKWNSNEWAGLHSGESCPICERGRPLNIIAELSVSYFTATAQSLMKGYSCLVLKRHAVELFELVDDEGSKLMQDIQISAKAIDEIYRPIKMNYEIHGNTLPHLHVHLFPRYRGDIFEGGPIDPGKVKASPYGPGEFDHFVSAIQSRLS